ncbi:MAG: hypothetical protein L0Z49_00195 [Actinobacteria bacterium]|nr:hypothetical protein [Actinomycetota bacterium]MCI0542846.1 hypothetical protein [Actinomycetota bacterium]
MAVVMTVAMALLAVSLTAVASLGLLYAARAQAVTGSDAAALAAAVATYPGTGRGSPRVEAAMAASRNGARLVACVCPTDSGLGPRVSQVTVTVRVDVPVFGVVTVRATSRAEFDPRAWLGR